MKNLKAFALAPIALSLLSANSAYADELSYPQFRPTQSDFGGIGLMQMPTGRFAKEGEFSFGASRNDDYWFYSLSMQLFPWFESTVRYAQMPDLLYSQSESFSGDTILADKSIDLKLRLLKESFWLPETAIGFRDLGGTGLFDGEFIAASKHIGNFDLTLGVGWGYIGNSANLYGDKALGADCNRGGSTGQGGTVGFDRFFHGCSSIYGGLEYQTPWKSLSLKLEYDANDYTSDRPFLNNQSRANQKSNINIGANYYLNNWGNLRISYQRGSTWTLGFNLQTNFHTLAPTWKNSERYSYQEPPPEEMEDTSWENVAGEFSNISGYKNIELYSDGEESITVVASQVEYRDSSEAKERIAIVLANKAPPVSEYRIIDVSTNIHTVETRIDAEKFTEIANYSTFDSTFSNVITTLEPTPPQGELVYKSIESQSQTFGYTLSPTFDQSFGNAEGFYLFNVGADLETGYWINDHLRISGSAYINIYDNYDNFNFIIPSDGASLPRVRTLIRDYLHKQPVRLEKLQLTWSNKIQDNWYAQAYGGYLETMYAGAGGELLYRTLNSNWAFGLDLNYVIQRDPSSTFKLLTERENFDSLYNAPYLAQTGTITGHLSAYYQPEWKLLKDTLFHVSAGQYLAEDYGVTVDFSKQFDSGVIVGAYAAKTNLSAEEFGEGSFNKGFYISMPFDLIRPSSTTDRFNIGWAPITRDGGQKLERQQLFDTTDDLNPWVGRPIKK